MQCTIMTALISRLNHSEWYIDLSIGNEHHP
jgi:hypothetical protein